jgi:alkylhydroperoxidase/carboxymuconolactone decarboxylase family protein YurZ
LITGSDTEQLRAHFGIAKHNGLSETELKEASIQLASHEVWPTSDVRHHCRQGGFND